VIEQLISRVFYARNVAHFEHWRSTGQGSYARHQALGDFYEDIVEALDDLVEAYQGAFGLIGGIPAPETPKGDVLDLLEDHAAWIEENHEKVCKKNRAVANLIDTLTAIYLSTIYKLKNLE
jgi:DNA-binding ferritin-like protein